MALSLHPKSRSFSHPYPNTDTGTPPACTTHPSTEAQAGQSRDLHRPSCSALGVNTGKEIPLFLPNTDFHLGSIAFTAPCCRLCPTARPHQLQLNP